MKRSQLRIDVELDVVHTDDILWRLDHNMPLSEDIFGLCVQFDLVGK